MESCGVGTSFPWRGDWFPTTAGTQFHAAPDRWYIYTTGSSPANTAFSECYVRHLTNVRWIPGKRAYAWMYVSGNIGAVGGGEVAIAYVKVAFYNEANSIPGTWFPTAITEYQAEMDNAGYTNRLYLTTPPAPSGTYSARLWFGLYKSPTVVGIQLAMSVYDTYLGVLIP